MTSYSERWRNEVAIPETDYADLLNTAVSQIHASRNAIAIQVNTAAMTTYWNLGKMMEIIMQKHIYTIAEITSLSAPIFKKNRITNAYIFGSYARGTANETSDIDFLVDIEGSNVQM